MSEADVQTTATEPTRVNGRIVHLFWTVPLALLLDVPMWGACRWFVLAQQPVRFPENQYLIGAWIVLLIASMLIGASVSVFPWASPRVRLRLFVAVTLVAFAIFVILLPIPTVGPTFN